MRQGKARNHAAQRFSLSTETVCCRRNLLNQRRILLRYAVKFCNGDRDLGNPFTLFIRSQRNLSEISSMLAAVCSSAAA